MKILDRYIFKSFVKTFLSVFAILILIFLLQSIWVYISELAGKDLDVVVIAKLLCYLTPNLIPMVLPLTILVASIMTFGSFAENYEFAAMKASGISLQRAMRSLILFIGILGMVTFYFANTVIPWSRYKSINLRANIKRMKPALAIVEGMFTQIGDYNIKVEKKTGKNGQDLHHVIIHKKMKNNRGLVVIKAKSGKLAGSGNSNILSLELYDGTLYQKVYSRKYKERRRRPFIKNSFKKYSFNIDLSSFNDVDLSKDRYSTSASMLDISELKLAVDSLSQRFNKDKENFRHTLQARNGTNRILGVQPKEAKKMIKLPKSLLKEDTITYHIHSINAFFASYAPRKQRQFVNLALTKTKGTLRTVEGREKNFSKKAERLNKAEIEIHQKYVLGIMCLVLFFVGAPLGAIIRKGGIGTPLVVAILLFLVYHYIGMFAKNSAEDGSISPFLASWLSTFIMLPLSVLVTYQATTDRSFFNLDVIIVPLKRVFDKIKLKKGKKEKNKT